MRQYSPHGQALPPAESVTEGKDTMMRRLLLIAALLSLAACKPEPAATTAIDATPPELATGPEVAELSLVDAQRQLADGTLTQAYLDRIARIDKAGQRLNSVIELNPDAIKDAEALDAERKAGKARGPLHGIPQKVQKACVRTGGVNTFGETFERRVVG